MTYHYCYRITNNATNKHYYGSRTSNVPPLDDLGVRYFSSSKYLKQDIAIFGVHQFTFKIIRSFPDRARAFIFEHKCQSRLRADEREDFYNRSIVPIHGKFSRSGPLAEETKQKISKKAKQRYHDVPMRNEHKHHLSQILSEQMRHMTAEERSKKFGNFGTDNPFYGRTHTEETKRQLSETSRQYNETYGNSFSGKHHTDTIKRQLSQQMKDRWSVNREIYANACKPRQKFPCERCGILVSRGMYNRWHADGRCDPEYRKQYCESTPSHNKGNSVVLQLAKAITETETGIRVLCGQCNQWFALSTFKRYHTGEHHGASKNHKHPANE